MIDLVSLLSVECIQVPLAATERFQAIKELVDLLDQRSNLDDRDKVLESVVARERTKSTGVGGGLAVPHGKSAGLQSLSMAIGKPAEPIEFDSIDGSPCWMIFLLASPLDQTGPHIQALAGISRLWHSEGFRVAVSKAGTADEVAEAIRLNTPLAS